MKYKVGDRVRIKKDADNATHENTVYIGMQRFLGVEGIIEDITPSNYICIAGYYWKTSQVEPLIKTWETLQVGDVVLYDYTGLFVDKDDIEEMTVLGRLENLIFLSSSDNPEEHNGTYHYKELENNKSFRIKTESATEQSIEIEGEKYTVAEIKEALRKK